MFPRAAHLLDTVQHLEQLDRFDERAFVETLGAEMPPPGGSIVELEGQLDALRAVLAEIDRFAEKSMRIRLTRSVVELPRELRTLLQTTITAYADDLPLLRRRIAPALERLGAPGTTDEVIEVAGAVLGGRARLHAGVHELAGQVAAAWLPTAERATKDRSQPDEQRERWGRARVDLVQVAASGAVIEAGSFDQRLARLPKPEEPPEEEPRHRFEFIEIDD